MNSFRSLAVVAAFAVVLCPLQAVQAQASEKPPAALKPGDTFKECRNCPEMTVLPAGKFTVGSPPDQPLRRENEVQKEITFARPFAIATTAVTW